MHSDQRLVLVRGVLLVVRALLVVRGRGGARGGARGGVRGRDVAERLADRDVRHARHVAIGQRPDVRQSAGKYASIQASTPATMQPATFQHFVHGLNIIIGDDRGVTERALTY